VGLSQMLWQISIEFVLIISVIVLNE